MLHHLATASKRWVSNSAQADGQRHRAPGKGAVLGVDGLCDTAENATRIVDQLALPKALIVVAHLTAGAGFSRLLQALYRCVFIDALLWEEGQCSWFRTPSSAQPDRWPNQPCPGRRGLHSGRQGGAGSGAHSCATDRGSRPGQCRTSLELHLNWRRARSVGFEPSPLPPI